MSKDVNLDDVKKLLELAEKHNLAELTVEENGVTITIKGFSAQVDLNTAAMEPVHHVLSHIEQTTQIQHSSQQQSQPSNDPEENLFKIESPMVGVFYRASSPDAPPFVEIGDTIEVGQTVGLIEAMKIFNEIPSEVAGVVVDIPGQNGKLVQQGDPLVVVRVEK